jgi:hypothetical protein
MGLILNLKLNLLVLIFPSTGIGYLSSFLEFSLSKYNEARFFFFDV